MHVTTGQDVNAQIDGVEVLLRPIQPSDFDLEREFVDGLSRHTSYQRLMSARRPSAAELHRWTSIDPRYEGALIATVRVGGREVQVGVARYAMEQDEDEAELAIVIADSWQGRGIGPHLLSRLIRLARQSGVKRFFGTTFSENAGMLNLARRHGFKLSRVAGAAIITEMSLVL